jgi:hypothetical protein
VLDRPCLLLSDNPDGMGGQCFNFLHGDLVSLSLNPDATPFSMPPMSQQHAPSHSMLPQAYPQTGSHGAPSPFQSHGPPSYTTGFPSGPQYIPGLAPQALEKPLVLTEPFYVTGVIFKFWRNAGGIKSTYGRPLSVCQYFFSLLKTLDVN